jgi:hypothetical protein
MSAVEVGGAADLEEAFVGGGIHPDAEEPASG